MEERSKCCCFTGHRPEKLNIDEKRAKELLTIAVRNAINGGFSTFITGMAKGIDIWAGEVVLSFMEQYPHLHLVCALPYPTFYKGRSSIEQARYQNLIAKADITHMSYPFYDPRAFQSRNMWMVDNSTLLIAAFTGASGGTKNTVDYAKKQNVEIVNILI